MTVNSFGADRPAVAYFSDFDLAFTVGESPSTLDANAVLGKNAVNGFVSNVGSKVVLYKTSPDGITFGSDVNLDPGTSHDLDGISIHTIELVWVGNTGYEVKLW